MENVFATHTAQEGKIYGPLPVHYFSHNRMSGTKIPKLQLKLRGVSESLFLEITKNCEFPETFDIIREKVRTGGEAGPSEYFS